MRIGLVGLPNVGKSSLFNALTQAGAAIGSYPFTTIDRNVGVVPVPDPRLQQVAEVVGSREAVPATMEFVDIAGLVRGAHRGEGLGNQFLGHVREMDALLHAVRCFEADEVAHVDESVDPLRDIETIQLELALADLATIRNGIERLEAQSKSGEKQYVEALETVRTVGEQLDRGSPVRALHLTEQQRNHLMDLHLLTAKPTLYVANVGEGAFRQWTEAGHTDEKAWLASHTDRALRELGEYLDKTGEDVVIISARLEAELAELDAELRAEFLADLNLREPALYRLIRAGYGVLDLITFFTANQNQCQARTLERGTTAIEAAGKVHSDMQAGFIRAEVIPAKLLYEHGSFTAARESGAVRLEGRDYVVADGDVLFFRFSV